MITWWLGGGVVVAAALCAAAAELCARWWLRRRSTYYVWAPGTRFEIHLAREVFPERQAPVRFEVNADGERGGDVAGPEDGLYRVLVAGGSAAECLALDQHESWPGALERFLNAPERRRALGARRVHVGSIARSYVASADLDLILERTLPRYRRLALIVIMVGAGDVMQWLEDGAPPSIAPAPIPAARLFACHPEQRFGWTPRRLGLVEIARRVRRSWLRPRQVVQEGGAWYTAARKMRAEAKEIRTSVPDPAVMVDRFEHYFRRLVCNAMAHADRVLVARQPWFEKDYTPEETARFWHGGVGKAWKGAITAYYSLDVINRLMGLVDARAASLAMECGVEQVDLQAALPSSLRHYYDHTHFTPAGAAVVAQTIADAVVRRTATPAARPSLAIAVEVGDLPRRTRAHAGLAQGGEG